MSKKDKKINIRRFWDVDPATKVEQDKTKEYNRLQSNKDWLDEFNDDLTNTDDSLDPPE